MVAPASSTEEQKQTSLQNHEEKLYAQWKQLLFESAILQVPFRENSQPRTLDAVPSYSVVYSPFPSMREAILYQKGGKPSLDNRKAVTDITKLPYSAICVISSDFGQGTGAFIGKNLILTAAHNLLNENGKETTTISIVAGAAGHSAMLRTPTISSFHYCELAGTELFTDGNDFAIIVLEDCVDNRIGYLHMKALSDADLSSLTEVTVAGYPGDKCDANVGYLLFESTAKAKSEPNSMISYELDTYYGESGAPVWFVKDNEYYTIGVHVRSDKHSNWATRLTSSTAKKIEEWVKKDVDIRLMNLSLKQNNMPAIHTSKEFHAIFNKESNRRESFMGIIAGFVKAYAPTIIDNAWAVLKQHIVRESNTQRQEQTQLESLSPEAEYRCKSCQKVSRYKQIVHKNEEGKPECPKCFDVFYDPDDAQTIMLPPIQLFRVNNGELILIPGSLQILSEHFKSKSMIVLAAAGMMGTGKSTWLNAVAYCLGASPSQKTMFSMGQSMQTVTEGIWCLPYPLHTKDSPHTDVLLLDLEGTGGADKQRPEINIEIQKIYCAGFLLSSIIAVHTHMRLDGYMIRSLEQVLISYEKIKQQLGVDLPQMVFCVNDIDELIHEDGTSSKGKCLSFIAENLAPDAKGVWQASKPKVICKSSFPEPIRQPESFVHASSTGYMQQIQQFVSELQKFVKKELSQKTNMTFVSFTKLCQLMESTVNNLDFEQMFNTSIDEVLLNEINPIIESLKSTYGNELKEMAMTISIDTTEKAFKEIAELKFLRYREMLRDAINVKFTRKAGKSTILKKLMNTFNEGLSCVPEAELILLGRKLGKATSEKNAAEQKEIANLQAAKQQELEKIIAEVNKQNQELREMIDKTTRAKEQEAAKMAMVYEKLAADTKSTERKTKCSFCPRKMTDAEVNSCERCGDPICYYHRIDKDGKSYCKKGGINHEPGCSIF